MAKILLIEDDPLIHRLYQKAFSLEGFGVEIAEDGNTGLEKVQGYKPDIILLDMMMPNMNGLEVLSKLKADAATSSIPVIVLTNIADMNVDNLATSKGAVQYIIKSQTEPAEIITLIKGVLAKANEQAQPTEET
jgi:CheY-like chemotaxis protein